MKGERGGDEPRFGKIESVSEPKSFEPRFSVSVQNRYTPSVYGV